MTPLTAEERAVLMESLQGGGEALVEAVAELTAPQWVHRPASGGWTIAEICEHVELTERLILAQLQTAGTDGLAEAAGKDRFVIKAVTSRRTKVPAPEAMIPAARWASAGEFLRQFAATRGDALGRARDEGLDLRGVCARHFALGPLDGYQWLLMTASHTLRHLEQIKEVRAEEGFPGAA